jgi:ABC-type transport system involved in multi-copper enzyme maturation permease subunit
MKTIFTISRLTFHEAYRRKILWAALILGLLFLVVYGLGFYFIQQDIERSIGAGRTTEMAKMEITSFLLMAGLYAVNFLTIGVSVLVSVDTLSGEINSGTMQTLISKPVKRWHILIGKWLGFVLMLTLYLILMAGGTMGIVYAIMGYTAPNMLEGLAIMWMNGLLMLSLSFIGGTYLSTLANGVLAFGLFGVAFVGGWIEQIGWFTRNQVAVNIGIISSLIIPSEALWKKAAHLMESSRVAALGFSPFTAASPPSPMMVGYAILYILVLLGLAVRQFGRRDI